MLIYRLSAVIVLFLVLGCADEGTETVPEVADASLDDASLDTSVPDSTVSQCESGVSFWFDESGGTELVLYPNDRYTQPDEDSPTGIRLRFESERFPWFDNLPNLIAPARADMESFSGFAHNGGVIMRYHGATLPELPSPEMSTTNDGLIWIDMDADPIKRIPFSASHTLDETGFILDPLDTLTPGHQHAVIVTPSLWPTETCIQPNPDFHSILSNSANSDFGDARFAQGVIRALELLSIEPETLVGATTFTTHMDHLKLKAVADEVLIRNYTWQPGATCESNDSYKVCDAQFKAWDFRDPKMIVTPQANAQWTLEVRIYLPADTSGPLPVIIYGHGLNSGRTEADRLAEEFADGGFALVAIDSLMHGDHPTRIPESMLPALDFLGVDIPAARVDGAAMHGNFTQTVVDRLQLLQLIRRHPDFDNDGVDDFDPSQIGYFGVSLGGMLGSLFLANTHGIPAAILSISGGRLIQFLTDIPQLAPFRPALNTLAGGEIKAERVLVFAQSLIDSADPATFAQFILKDRLYEGTEPPHLLMPVADQDDTVPPQTAYSLARSLDIPHVGPVFTEVFGLEQQDAPASNNTRYGVTAGYFQFDRITRGDRVEIATHSRLPPSPEAFLQTRHFLSGWLAGDTPEIIDPYAQLETPAL
jgi:dienelactone hydrolase